MPVYKCHKRCAATRILQLLKCFKIFCNISIVDLYYKYSVSKYFAEDLFRDSEHCTHTTSQTVSLNTYLEIWTCNIGVVFTILANLNGTLKGGSQNLTVYHHPSLM